MALNEEEPTDLKLEDVTATLALDGRNKEYDNIYSDTQSPYRRDVIVGDIDEELPPTTKVEYAGNTYEARLGFLYRQGGASVPAYHWYVTSKATKE